MSNPTSYKHDSATVEKIRQQAIRREAQKRGELIVVEEPSPADLQKEFKHTWADLEVRLKKLCDVAEKCYIEIMASSSVPPRLVEVLNQTADGIAKEVGARQQKSQVELSGSVQSQVVYVEFPSVDEEVEDEEDVDSD